MARVNNNALLKGISGSLGEVVVKQYSYGTVVSKKPDMSGVRSSQLQEVKRNLFKEAVAFAQAINRDPKKKAEYAKNLKPGQTVFNAAVSEYMRREKER